MCCTVWFYSLAALLQTYLTGKHCCHSCGPVGSSYRSSAHARQAVHAKQRIQLGRLLKIDESHIFVDQIHLGLALFKPSHLICVLHIVHACN